MTEEEIRKLIADVSQQLEAELDRCLALRDPKAGSNVTHPMHREAAMAFETIEHARASVGAFVLAAMQDIAWRGWVGEFVPWADGERRFLVTLAKAANGQGATLRAEWVIAFPRF